MAIIALISDIHFGNFSRTEEFAVPGVNMKDESKGGISLKESLVKILIDNQAQYLFIAGDLTSTGSPHEFYYCQNEILSIADSVGIPKDNIIIGLGNHDVDWQISKICEQYASMSGTSFPLDLVTQQYQMIAANASVYNMNNISQPKLSGPAPYSGIIEKECFVAFILNSGWTCAHNQNFRHGRLTQEQLDWFKEKATYYKSDKRWKIVLLHHHPFNYSYPTIKPDISTLEEGSKFLDIAGENGINMVLHGHRHHPKAKTVIETGWLGPITFICAGSVSVYHEERCFGQIPNTCHIIYLLSETPETLKLKNYQYTSSDGWIPVHTNCPEVPLDSIMYLGKVFKQEEINSALLSLVPNKLLQWEELPELLRCLPFSELNSKIQEYYSGTSNIVGKFPDDVCLLDKGVDDG